MTTSSSDASTIQTVKELSSFSKSSKSQTTTSAISSARSSKDGYHSDSLWETTSQTSSRYGELYSDGSHTEGTLDSISDRTRSDSGRRGGAKRIKEGGASLDSYTSSYYSSESSYSDNSNISPAHQSRYSQQFVRSKLNNLRRSKPQGQFETAQMESPSEDGQRRQDFCRNIVHSLERKTNDPVMTRKKNMQPASKMSSTDCPVLASREIIDRLKIENLLSTMKEVTSTDVSDEIDSCSHCSELQEANLQRTFVRQRTAKLENELTERRLDWYLSTKDPLTVIGELVKTLPMPSDDPKEIWNQLMTPRVTCQDTLTMPSDDPSDNPSDDPRAQ